MTNPLDENRSEESSRSSESKSPTPDVVGLPLYGGTGVRRARPGAASKVPVVLLAVVLVATGALLAFLHFKRRASDSVTGGAGGEFTYDLRRFMEVDPALILYEESKVFGVKFEEPRGLASFGGGKICVAGDRGLKIFDGEGALIAEVSVDGEPICVGETTSVGEAAGHYYVALRDHVQVYDSKTRKRLAKWDSLGKEAFLTSLAVTPKEVYLADAGQRVVWRFDLTGKRLGEIGRKDHQRGIPGLVVPSPHMDVAMAPDGLLRVVNPGRHRIEAYTADGHLELFWGKYSPRVEGFSGCCNPCGFALTPSGAFVTCEKGIPRVKEYDSSGGLVGVVAAPREFAEAERVQRGDRSKDDIGSLDVAVDAESRVLVLDPLARTVKIFVKTEKT